MVLKVSMLAFGVFFGSSCCALEKFCRCTWGKGFKKYFQSSELTKGFQSPLEPGTEALVMHWEVQAGGCGRPGCSWASPSTGMSPFKFPGGTNRQSQGLSSYRPSIPSSPHGPQAIPVLCRDAPAVQPSPATYWEDSNEPAWTHLL